jgi:hypothetical protein
MKCWICSLIKKSRLLQKCWYIKSNGNGLERFPNELSLTFRLRQYCKKKSLLRITFTLSQARELTLYFWTYTERNRQFT